MTQRARLSQPEFIGLMAMLMAVVAYSIDSMLPALPAIAQSLSPEDVNRAQLLITSFMLGLGMGTFFSGPLSDALGRKPILVGGMLIYAVGAVLAWVAPSLELLLAARVLQGLGASGPRVVTMAVTRDMYAGPPMARIMSFVMIVFMIVPAVAPSLGALIIWAAGWRMVFASFLVFALISCGWAMTRLPETHPPEARKPFSLRAILTTAREMAGLSTVRLALFVQLLCMGMLLSALSSVQQLFSDTYGRGAQFPLWFAAIAVIASTSGMLNARLVVRLGMRALIKAMLTAQVIISGVMLIVLRSHLATPVEFILFFIWVSSVFFQAGLTMGNLNALAMEPMGHAAGRAASIIAALGTVGAVGIAAPVGQAYDGTAAPVVLAVFVMALVARVVTSFIKRPGELGAP